MQLLEPLYRLLISIASRLDSAFLRVYRGVQMAQTGWGKLHSLVRVTSFFASLGIPGAGSE